MAKDFAFDLSDIVSRIDEITPWPDVNLPAIKFAKPFFLILAAS
jgi:hypothetical protein